MVRERMEESPVGDAQQHKVQLQAPRELQRQFFVVWSFGGQLLPV